MIITKFLKKILSIVFILFLTPSYAENKIYFLDMDYVMNNSIAGKSLIKKLNIEQKKNLDSFTKIENTLKEKEKKIYSQKNILDKNEYKKKVELFQKEVKNYQFNRSNLIKEFSNKSTKGKKNLLTKITPILSEYAKENSISYIIPKQNIIIGKSDLDLTNILLKIIDSKVKDIKIQ